MSANAKGQIRLTLDGVDHELDAGFSMSAQVKFQKRFDATLEDLSPLMYDRDGKVVRDGDGRPMHSPPQPLHLVYLAHQNLLQLARRGKIDQVIPEDEDEFLDLIDGNLEFVPPPPASDEAAKESPGSATPSPSSPESSPT